MLYFIILFFLVIIIYVIHIIIDYNKSIDTRDFYKFNSPNKLNLSNDSLKDFYSKNWCYVKEGDILLKYDNGKYYFDEKSRYSWFLEIINKAKKWNYSNYYYEAWDLVYILHKNGLSFNKNLENIYNFYNFRLLNITLHDNKVIYTRNKYWESIKIFFNTWDVVKKWDLIWEMKIKNWYEQADLFYNENNILWYESIYSWIDWIFELSDNFLNWNLEEWNELFIIHNKPTKEELNELKIKRYRNIPIVKIDEFTWKKEIKWKFVGWKQVRFFSYISWYFINDKSNLSSFIDLNWKNNLYFTINYLDNNDYLIFRYLNNDIKLYLMDKITFLLSNWELLEFSINEKSYKIEKNIYETKVKITYDEIISIKEYGIKNWQVDFSNSWNKIQWIKNNNLIYITKVLFSDYIKVISDNINNYKPLQEKEIYNIKSIVEKKECYVYLMFDNINWYHKIWISNKPEYREKTLQSEKPAIEMITNKKFPNREIALAFEQALHKTYQEKRIRGEWFDLDDNEINDLKLIIK